MLIRANGSTRRCPCVRTELAGTTHCHPKQRSGFGRKQNIAVQGLKEAEAEVMGAAHAQQEDSNTESTIEVRQ